MNEALPAPTVSDVEDVEDVAETESVQSYEFEFPPICRHPAHQHVIMELRGGSFTHQVWKCILCDSLIRRSFEFRGDERIPIEDSKRSPLHAKKLIVHPETGELLGCSRCKVPLVPRLNTNGTETPYCDCCGKFRSGNNIHGKSHTIWLEPPPIVRHRIDFDTKSLFFCTTTRGTHPLFLSTKSALIRRIGEISLIDSATGSEPHLSISEPGETFLDSQFDSVFTKDRCHEFINHVIAHYDDYFG